MIWKGYAYARAHGSFFGWPAEAAKRWGSKPVMFGRGILRIAGGLLDELYAEKGRETVRLWVRPWRVGEVVLSCLLLALEVQVRLVQAFRLHTDFGRRAMDFTSTAERR